MKVSIRSKSNSETSYKDTMNWSILSMSIGFLSSNIMNNINEIVELISSKRFSCFRENNVNKSKRINIDISSK